MCFAISVDDIWKEYRLGVIGHGTLTHDLQSWWANIKGREDPNAKLSTNVEKAKGQVSGNSFWALRGIDIEIRRGEVLGIIGSNGAGKSTFLKILSRVTAPTRGCVKIKGNIASLLEVGTGFHPELTGRENIYLNGAILGMPKVEVSSKLSEIITFSGVKHHIDTPVKRYSSGMFVRLAFAVAAHLDPEILVVDEVLAVGDAEFQKKCLGKMDQIAQEGRTVLFVSHNMSSIERLCTSACIIDKGKLVNWSKNVREVVDTYLNKLNANYQTCWSAGLNNEKVANEYFIPSKLYVENKNRNAALGSIKNNIDILVSIEGEIIKPHSALQIGYALYNQHGNVLYWSFSTDEDSSNWPKIEAGPCRFVSTIPKNILNEGTYRLELLIAVYHVEWIFKPGSSPVSITFNISGGLSNSIYWLEKRPGELAPIMRWNYSNIEV